MKYMALTAFFLLPFCSQTLAQTNEYLRLQQREECERLGGEYSYPNCFLPNQGRGGNLFAAIACPVGDGVAAGGAYDAPSKQEAETTAIDTCSGQEGKPDCEVMVWTEGGCAAVAAHFIDSSRSRISCYGEWSPWKYVAQQNAMSTCSKNSSECEVIAATCANGG